MEKLKEKFIKNEKGDAFIISLFMTTFVVICISLILNIILIKQNETELQMAADSASLGGAIIAAKGYTTADKGGSGSVVMVVRAEADAKATEILKANVEEFRHDLNLSKVRYNEKSMELNGKTLTPNQQYFSGYFTVRLEAECDPFLGRYDNLTLRKEATSQVRPIGTP